MPVQRKGNEGKMAKSGIQNKTHHHRWHRRAYLLLCCLGLIGCSSMKEMVWTSGVGAGVGTAVSVATGNPLPAVAAGALSSGLTAGLISDSSAMTSNPENATTGYGVAAVIGKESIRWLGICGILLVIFGWLVPSPFKLNRREK